MYFGPILFSSLLPPLMTVQTQQVLQGPDKGESPGNYSNGYSLWRPVQCAVCSICASPDPASTLLCSEFWEADLHGLASKSVQ